MTQLFWEIPYIENGKRKTIVKQAPHRRAAERGVPNHVGTAMECPPPVPKPKPKLKKGKSNK